MKYRVLEDYFASALSRQVEKMLGEGWELQGGVSWAESDPGGKYYQAVVKK